MTVEAVQRATVNIVVLPLIESVLSNVDLSNVDSCRMHVEDPGSISSKLYASLSTSHRKERTVQNYRLWLINEKSDNAVVAEFASKLS